MQGIKRKIIYVVVFEAIAITVSSFGFSGLSDQPMTVAGMLAVAVSAIAVLWNLLFNTLFEAWEARQQVRRRSLLRRISHATLFETGLIVTLVPLIAWWLDLTLMRAFVINLGLSLFFLVYAFVYNWTFDLIFGLPAAVDNARSINDIDFRQSTGSVDNAA